MPTINRNPFDFIADIPHSWDHYPINREDVITLALKRVDEFDGKSDAEIVTFSIDGNDFEIDLSADSKRQLYRDMERYINAAHKVATRSSKSKKKSTPSSAPSSKPAEGGIDNDAVRSWARSTGKKVSDRGRIPRDVVDAFVEAQAPSATAPAFSGAGV